MHQRNEHPRQVAAPALRLRPPALWLLAACALWLAALVGPGRAQGPAPRTGGAALEVTTCPADDPAACDAPAQTVSAEPAPPARPGSATGAASQRTAAAPAGRERHDVSLRTGRDRVRNDAGVVDGRADVQLRGRPIRRPAAAPAPAPGAALPAVSTDAGSPFAGFGGGLAFLSPREALSRFVIPPFLVPIYVAAGRAYGVPWNVLAAINQIETDFGRIRRQVSSAGALGWMQFMPDTWRRWGVDASGDGIADPYNPVDAIYAAARYLRASGAATDLRGAVLAYNRAGWYADSVLRTAAVYGSLPSGLVDETGSLAFGRFPLLGAVSYGDDFRRAQQAGRPTRGLLIRGAPGARAVATQQVTVKRILLDRSLAAAMRSGGRPGRGLRRARPREIASLEQLRAGGPVTARVLGALESMSRAAASLVARLDRALGGTPRRPAPALRAPSPSDGLPAGFSPTRARGIAVVVADALGNEYRYGGLARVGPGVRPGARLRGRQLVGRLPLRTAPALRFSLRGAGGSPVDPRPLVDGYRLQEVANFAHAVAPLGGSPFLPTEGQLAGGLLSGSERALARRVLDDPGIAVYPGGRQDIARGLIDRRVLGALIYLRRSGLTLGVSSLRTGHGYYTAGGNVSAHSYGAAVDISSFNGQPVAGNQGPGSLIEQAIRLLMRLDGPARPAQLISLMALGGPSFALADHYDHLHLGYSFSPTIAVGRSGDALGAVTFDGRGLTAARPGRSSAADERRLSQRLGSIVNPNVRRGASGAGVAIETESRAERALAPAGGLQTFADAAGARLIDVSVPRGGGAGEAYAIGTVDGRGHGWAAQQVVVLARHAGAWRLVGPPLDARGRARNPALVALAVVRGGRGYAVGARGQVVRLDGAAAPRLLARATRVDLAAVDVTARAGAVTGLAVGARGTAVALQGERARREQAAGGAVRLTAVTVAGGAPVAVGAEPGRAAVLVQRGPARWRSLDTGPAAPADAAPRLLAVARAPGELWVAGRLAGAGGDAGGVRPFAARLRAGRWRTWCAASPALAAVSELGAGAGARTGCDGPLAPPPTPAGATDLAATGRGALLVAGGQLQALDGERFRPVLPLAGAPALDGRSAWRLALSAGGRGWLLGPSGQLQRVAPASERQPGANAAAPVAAALPAGGATTIAAAPGGRVLALAGGSAAVLDAGRWSPAPPPGVAVRQAALWRSGGYAVSATGALLSLGERAWSRSAGEAAARGPRLPLGLVLGGDGPAAAPAAGGWAGVSLDAAGNGYAVGAGGAVARLSGSSQRAEATPVDTGLTSVAARGESAVATGGGVLLERDDGRWVERPDAEGLAAGAEFTATAAAADGTLLAVAGGTLLAREPHVAGWQLAPLAPLGQPVRRLAALRTAAGGLRAVALVGELERLSVLVGDGEGWRSLGDAGLDRVTDIALDPASGRLTVAGLRGSRPAVAVVDLDAQDESR